MKKIILKLASFAFLLLLSYSCQNNIEFQVKSNFDVIANVSTTSGNGSIVSDFDVTSTIDLSDNIDNVDNIIDLQVTGVSLQLMEYDPHTTHLLDYQPVSTYHTNPLTGRLKVTLLSNSKEKVLYEGDVNLGTNVETDEGGLINAPVVTLSITPTQAKDLIENKKIKLKIECTNGVIRDTSFKIKIIAQTEALTEI